jgi:F-type H+-transporting ATPase subunit delta
MISAAANRYARALVEVVAAPGSATKPADAVAQLRSVVEMVDGSRELQDALLTPAIQASRKRAALGKLMDEMAISRTIRNFIFVVVDHRRVAILRDILEAFEVALDAQLGIVRANVVSAEALDPAQSDALSNGLARVTGTQVRLRFEVDSELIGGVVARIGSTVYDGSLRGQLRDLRRRLTETTAEQVGI